MPQSISMVFFSWVIFASFIRLFIPVLVKEFKVVDVCIRCTLCASNELTNTHRTSITSINNPLLQFEKFSKQFCIHCCSVIFYLYFFPLFYMYLFVYRFLARSLVRSLFVFFFLPTKNKKYCFIYFFILMTINYVTNNVFVCATFLRAYLSKTTV